MNIGNPKIKIPAWLIATSGFAEPHFLLISLYFPRSFTQAHTFCKPLCGVAAGARHAQMPRTAFFFSLVRNFGKRPTRALKEQVPTDPSSRLRSVGGG